jgi:hypothetical protein
MGKEKDSVYDEVLHTASMVLILINQDNDCLGFTV